ncbi:MAG: cytochrome C, partial [Rhodocyclales bacterium]|nr:cytochrome C [Rhodocyclales bacterium]
MRTNKFVAWVVAAAVYATASLAIGSVAAATTKDAAPAVAHKLDNATCQTCHDGNKGKLEVPGAADGGKRALQTVKQDKYAKSVHAKMECVGCHKEIIDSVTPHQKVAGASKVECAQCHLDLWEAAKKDNKTAEKPRLGIVAENVAAYKKSFHARDNKDDPTKKNATCSDCHNVHTFDVPPRGTPERKEWHLTVPDICGKCHEDHLEDWTGSVHGKEVKEKHNLKSAVCSDCHTTHDIVGSSSDKAKLSITASCGECHKDAYESYKASYHGQVNRLGYAYTAKCADCHGSHAIEPSKDPKSKLHPKNRLKTCQKCHSGKEDKPPLATAGFLSFSPHGNSHDFAKYPEIWLTTKAMIALLVGVFAFFWLHSGMWWYREYADRKQGKNVPHVMTDKLPPEFANRHVKRFGPMWRIAHLLFALSVMMLVLTGMAAFTPETSWAKTVMATFGTPKIAGQ